MRQIVPPSDAAYSLQSCDATNFPAPNVQCQIGRKKMIKANEVSNKVSYERSLTYNCPSDLMLKGSGDGNSTETIIEETKEDRALKRNTRRKGKKKGKRNERQSSETDRSKLGVLHGVDISEKMVPGNVSHEHPLVASETESKQEGVTADTDFAKEIDLRAFSDAFVSLVFNPVSVGADYVNGDPFGSDARLSEQPGLQSRKVFPENGGADQVEEMKHGIQDLSRCKVQASRGKKGKQSKDAVSRTSRVHRNGNLVAPSGRRGIENNHVWQRVQRNDDSNCKSECSLPGSNLKSSPFVKRNLKVADAKALSKSEDSKKSKDEACKKFKRKISPESKQKHSSYCRKSSHPIMAISATAEDAERLSNNISATWSQIGSARSRIQANGNCINPKSVQSSQGYPGDMEMLECVSSTVPRLNCQNVETSGSSSPNSCISLEKSCLLEGRFPVYLPHLLMAENRTSLVESSKHNLSSGSILQKWVPIGMKDLDMTSSGACSTSSLQLFDRPTNQDWNSGGSSEEEVASNSQRVVPVLDADTQNLNCPCQDVSRPEKVNVISCILEESKNKHAAPGFVRIVSRDHDVSSVRNGSYKITRTVDDACEAQLVSETVQMTSGTPIAEFERLVHLASPAFRHSTNLVNCKICSRDQTASFLCRHEIPSIFLGCLWKWYEKHGSYGLEVRGEDYENPSRMGVDRFAFCAYFVPYLSAVQLFKDHRSHSAVTTTQEKLESDVVPQRRDSSAYQDVCRGEEDPLSAKAITFNISGDMSQKSDLELLFEYFESEQPQQRQPLYTKIQELVVGNVPSNCKAYGDPKYLNSIHLDKLHPVSWYSVAWYPIYRIPDGKFRAAFLTYHSLGQFVHRTINSEFDGTDTCIVSPVVGLESYNAQSECWFQPRPKESKCSDTPGMVKRRLRMLEETASRMSRAVVDKGTHISINTHPDYEFFLSRRQHVHSVL